MPRRDQQSFKMGARIMSYVAGFSSVFRYLEDIIINFSFQVKNTYTIFAVTREARVPENTE